MTGRRVLSLCCGMGLMDRAFLDAGFEVVAGCEIDPDQRRLYEQVCGDRPMCDDLADLPKYVAGERFAGVIGGPPCQSLTKLRAMRRPKFADLTPAVRDVLGVCSWDWLVFENVARLAVGDCKHARLNAMHYGRPHQSRARWFTFSGNLRPPAPLYHGTVDGLFAYSVVAGRIYGPKRGAALQGWPKAADLDAPCVVIQKGLANAVHYGLALAWAKTIRAAATSALAG